MVFSPSTIRSVDMSSHAVVARLLDRLHQVRELLRQEQLGADANTRFVDALDSMGFVEFLALVAEDYGVPVETIEQAAGRRYGSVGEFAAALDAAGLSFGRNIPPQARSASDGVPASTFRTRKASAWLAATAARLPANRQPASTINALLNRPPGWLEEHAGIESRYLWGEDDPLDAAALTAQECLRQADLSPPAVGALLVTSEAPPLLIGLAAALHERLGLPSGSVALEIGGGCTGFLSAVWTAQHLLSDMAAVLVIAIEAPSRWLSLSPTRVGEAAALFGDAAAACLLTSQPAGANSLHLRDIVLGTDGAAGPLLRVEMTAGHGAELHMDGIALAHRAVRTMADAVRNLCTRNGLAVDRLAAVVAHGGNGRMPALLARRLNLQPQLVQSETARTGNLGSASLPVAWSVRNPPIPHPVVWTALGAGLQWGAALLDALP
jgi:3-oxoacyl-[acyl-carrier-protein] synthase-3